MGLFNKANLKVEDVKKFLEENGIKWDGALVDAFRRGQNVFIDIDDKTFNKLISKPVRLLISSEQYKDIDVVTAGIAKDAFVLHGISENGYVDLTDKWGQYQDKAKVQEDAGFEPEM